MNNVVPLRKKKAKQKALKNRMHVQVDDNCLDALDSEAQRLGLSRAQVVRVVLIDYLESRQLKRA